MEELNQLFKGFKVLTTPYDKVDSRVVTKKNAITLLNQIGGGTNQNTPDTQNPPATQNPPDDNNEAGEGGNENEAAVEPTKTQTEDTKTGDVDTDPKKESEPGFLEKAKLAAAQASEESKGTTIPDGKEMMKKVVRVGAIIMYIMLLPLMPWYYIMKNSFAKLNVLYKGVVKPL